MFRNLQEVPVKGNDTLVFSKSNISNIIIQKCQNSSFDIQDTTRATNYINNINTI